MIPQDDILSHVAFVAALDVPPGAILVVKSDRRLTVEQATAIEVQVSKAFPNRMVLVLPPELNLTVVRETES